MFPFLDGIFAVVFNGLLDCEGVMEAEKTALKIRITSKRWVVPSGILCETAADIWSNAWEPERWWVTLIEMMLHG